MSPDTAAAAIADALADVNKRAARYRRALSTAERALQDRDACIREAYGRGASLAQIAGAIPGGMSRPNVLRIVSEGGDPS